MKDAVVAEGLTKVFRAERYLQRGLKWYVVNPSLWLRRRPRARFTALEGVSFRVARGETLGVLGRNGAGKSTLLALVGGILRPTRGSVRAHGRVSPLLGLGVGFAPELTGVENAILNAVLLGLRRAEAEALVPSILEFAEVAPFADQPLKTYSAGMRARLGFAVAVHTRPDILLMDEVLAVGDAEFQRRCLERVAALRRRGVTVLFVSHRLDVLERVCDRALWLERGRVRALGDAREVVEGYRRAVGEPTPAPPARAPAEVPASAPRTS